MFAFLELGVKPQKGFLKALSRFLRRDCGVDFNIKHFSGMPYMHVTAADLREFGDRIQKRQCFFIKEILRRNNIKELCFERDFPFKGELLKGQFREIAERTLNEAMMFEMAEYFSENGEKTAAVFSNRFTQKRRKMLFRLSEKFRFLLLCTAEDGYSLDKELRERCGVSPIFNPGKKRIFESELVLLFDSPDEEIVLAPDSAVIAADEAFLKSVIGGKIFGIESVSLPEKVKNELFGNMPVKQFVSEALRRGFISAEKIGVSGICETGRSGSVGVLDNMQEN